MDGAPEECQPERTQCPSFTFPSSENWPFERHSNHATRKLKTSIRPVCLVSSPPITIMSPSNDAQEATPHAHSDPTAEEASSSEPSLEIDVGPVQRVNPEISCLTNRCRGRASKATNATLPLATVNHPTQCLPRRLYSTFATRMAGGTMLTQRACTQCQTTRSAPRCRHSDRLVAYTISTRPRQIDSISNTTPFALHSTENFIEHPFQKMSKMSWT